MLSDATLMVILVEYAMFKRIKGNNATNQHMNWVLLVEFLVYFSPEWSSALLEDLTHLQAMFCLCIFILTDFIISIIHFHFYTLKTSSKDSRALSRSNEKLDLSIHYPGVMLSFKKDPTVPFIFKAAFAVFENYLFLRKKAEHRYFTSLRPEESSTLLL